MRKQLALTSLFAAISCLIALVSFISAGSSSAQAATSILEIDANESGYYTNGGNHNAAVTNYLVGEGDFAQLVAFRNFFVFDLPVLSGQIVTASLVVENPEDGYTSSDPSETWTIFEVATDIPTLIVGGTGRTSVFNDLADGPSYGAVSISGSSRLVSVPLNATAIAALNAHVGQQFAFGGALTTLDSTRNNEWAFGNTDETHVRKLILGIVEPAISLDNTYGAPGSFFNLAGAGFPANMTGTLTVNDYALGTITVLNDGSFTVTLSTDEAAPGYYRVSVSVNPTATTQLRLDNSAATHQRAGAFPLFVIPGGIAEQTLFLPFVRAD